MADTCSLGGSSDYCHTIVSNSDISGVGIRIAAYVQTIISMCVASFLPYNEKAFRDTSRNSYVMSGGLIIAAIIAWKRGQLSLFDGLIVSMLTTIQTAFVTVNGPYIKTLGLSINLSSFLFTSLWCYWGLQIWTNPMTFGLPPDGQNCNATTTTSFVVFGHNVSPGNHGLRGFAISVFAIGSIGAVSALWTCIRWVFMYVAGSAQVAKDQAALNFAKELRQKKGRKRHITKFGGLVGMIYMIVTTEQIVIVNPDVRLNLQQWTFSQTLALIMLGQQIMESAFYFHKECKIRREEARVYGPRA